MKNQREQHMKDRTQQIFTDALAMPPVQKAALIEKLFVSFDLDRQKKIDRLWAGEAEEKRQVVINGLQQGLEKKVIATLTGLSFEIIEKISQELSESKGSESN
ncbi:MAG: hypothetical protein D3925_12880 [Candidatus Electrothrix sp. AR5]|nr:hypothetical protein [Candidatus Electrothrix sp. AR5]